MNEENNHADSQAATNVLAVLLGGKTSPVTYRDGRTDEVRVRELEINEFEKLLPILDDEEASANLYCDKPAGWSKTLNTVSLEEVITEGERLNKDPFGRWLARRAARTAMMRFSLGLNNPA